MKALSLKQPFADLLAHGEKTIELRKWGTSFRGQFLVHSSKNIDIDACERLDIDTDTVTTGAIIGYAFLYDIKEYSNQEIFKNDKNKHFSIITKFFEGYIYGFLIRNATRLKKPIPYSDKIGFFEVHKSFF
ncbi:MAG: ASCH domain-containing protein [Nitrososphaeraceae archaeon]|nr:ASCH domain-containing protein [Nitrososphaeraceae archaeon]